MTHYLFNFEEQHYVFYLIYDKSPTFIYNANT